MTPKHRYASPNSQNISSTSAELEGRASKRGCRGSSPRGSPGKELLFARAAASGAIQRLRRAFTAMGTRTEHAAQSPPSRWAPWGRSPHKKRESSLTGRNEATREREPVARQPSTGLQLGADAVPRYAGRISRTVGFAVKTQCGGPGKVPCGNSKAKRSRFKTLLLLLLILLCALAKSWESGTRLRTGASVRS